LESYKQDFGGERNEKRWADPLEKETAVCLVQ